MTHVTRVVIEAQGAADVMKLIEGELSPPGVGELQIAHTAIGLNYMDVYQRSGSYPLPLPSALGLEAAGRVTAVGPEVEGFAVGDRVAYLSVLGAYATHCNVPAARAIQIPDLI